MQIKNGTDGHGVPTGFDVERLVWVHVAVQDASGKIIKESGDLDANGDVAITSRDGPGRQATLDDELHSLQGHFSFTATAGSEREQVLSTNYSPSPLPFLARAHVIHPPRPADRRPQAKEEYRAARRTLGNDECQCAELTGKSPYTAVVQLKTAMVPVNLVHEVRKVGFDYE